MPIKLNNGALKSVVDVKLNNGSLRTVTGIWYNNGGTLERVYPEFYSQQVYNGSKFSAFMKSGVSTTYATWQSSGTQTAGWGGATAAKTITSGALSFTAANTNAKVNGSDRKYYRAYLWTVDPINLSKFSSIRIVGSLRQYGGSRSGPTSNLPNSYITLRNHTTGEHLGSIMSKDYTWVYQGGGEYSYDTTTPFDTTINLSSVTATCQLRIEAYLNAYYEGESYGGNGSITAIYLNV